MKKSELEDVMLNTKSLFMVDIRFYDVSKGIEKEESELVPKAIVTKVGNDYFNVIIGERFPLVKYSTVILRDYIPFGGIKNPELMDEKGICYVEVGSNFLEEIKKQDQISIRELEEKMLTSDIYFKDRIYIIESRVNLSKKGIFGIKERNLAKLARKDWEKNCHFNKKIDKMKNIKKLQKVSN